MSLRFPNLVGPLISRLTRLLMISNRHPYFTISIILAVTVFFLILSSRLQVNNDYDTWLPEGDPLTQVYKEVNQSFSASAIVLVALDLGDVFTPEGIARIRQITATLEEIPEVFSVLSLTNIIDIRESGGAVEVARLGDRIRTTPEGMREFREYVLSREFYPGTFVSEDGRFANIVINIRDDAEEVEVAGRIKAIMEREKEEVYLGGDPIYTVYIDHYMEKDSYFTAPIALLCMIVVLFLGFRSGWGVFLPLSLAGIAIIWNLGLQALIGWPINVMTPGVVILIFAMGSDYAVHVLNRYRVSSAGEAPNLEIGPPVVMSALTTIAGLLTFATTKIAVLKWFGLEIAIGLGTAMFLSLTLLPAVMKTWGSGLASRWQTPSGRPDHFARAISRLAEWGIRRRYFIIGFLLLSFLVALPLVLKIKSSSNYLEMLPDDSLPRRAARILKEHFGGSYAQTLYLKGVLDDPAALKAMIRMENYHRSLPRFSGYTSIAGLIAEENLIMNGTYSIPDTRAGVASLWLLLEGDPLLRNLVTSDRSRGIISAYTSLEDAVPMEAAADKVNRFLATETGPELITLEWDRVPDPLKAKIWPLRIRQSAREISWLALYYSGHQAAENLENPIFQYLAGLPPELPLGQEAGKIIARLDDFVADELFIEEKTAQQEIKNAVAAVLEKAQEKPFDLSGLVPRLSPLLPGPGPGEREALAVELASWIQAETRRLKVDQAGEEIKPLFPDRLGPHFWKRARGVLQELYSPLPSFFSRQLEDLPIPEEAVASRSPLAVHQVGIPTFYAIFENLLRESQVQSLTLASVFVFFMIWLGLQLVRSAFFALSSVLASIFFILAVMGVTGIPLDFGTVLTGGLIIGLGVDGVIHIVYHYRRLGSRTSAIIPTVSEVGKAIITANCTTAAGLLAMTLSDIRALENFGLINGLAILIVSFLNLVLVPLLMVVFPIRENN